MADQTFMEEFRKRIGEAAPQAQAQSSNVNAPTNDFMSDFRSRIQQPVAVMQLPDQGGRIEDVNQPVADPTNPALSQGMGLWTQNTGQDAASLAQREAETIEANQAPGVPLDVQRGASSLTRLRLYAEQNRMEQLKMLREQYGEDAVRIAKDGRWIARVEDPQTKESRDILIDEEAMTVKDLADVAHKMPALAMSIMATKGIPAASIFRSAVMGALGWAGGDAAVEVASKIGQNRAGDIKPGEIIQEKGFQALTDTALGYAGGRTVGAMGSLGRLLRMASSDAPALLSEGASAAARSRVEGARQTVKGATGVKLEPTIGELTGNPIIQRLEAFFSNIPLARGFILKNMERRMANERAIQTELLKMAGGGSADVPDATKLGEQVLGAVGGKLQGLSQQAGELAGTLRQEATEALTGPLGEIAGAPLSSAAFGQRMIKRSDAQLGSFKNRAKELWDTVRSFPESTQPLFSLASIKGEAKRLSGELLKNTEGETAKALAPSGVMPILDAIENLPKTTSYFDLIKLRESIYDRMGSPEPISDRGTALLKKLGASVTSAMKEQGPRVFGPRKWADVEVANKFYSENVESFYQKGISNMLKPRTEAGVVDPERIAGSLLAGGKGSVTTYNTLKNFFEKSGAVKDMNRMLRDQLIDAGTDPATGLIKLESFSNGLNKMEPELVKEIYGTTKDKLLADARQAQLGLKVFGKLGGAIPESSTQAAVEAEALKEALGKGQIRSGTLKALVATTDEIQRTYRTELTKALTNGDIRLIEAAPEKFVRDFLLSPATSEKAAQNAMQHLMSYGDDQLVGDVKRLYLSDLFKSAASSVKGDVQQLVGMQTGSPLRNLDPQKFAIMLENEGVWKRMNMILGPELSNTMREFGIALAGQAGKDVGATTTGAFAGGTYSHMIIQALGGKLSALSALPDLAKYRLLSYLITNPDSIKTLRTVANGVPDLDKLIKPMVLTPEFAHALASDSATPEEAAEVTRQIQEWATSQP